MKSVNFIPSNYSENTIISNYSELLSSYNIKEMLSNFIPFLYRIPKFHKHPIAARFITSDRHTAPNTLSKVIGIGLGNLLKLQSTVSKNQYKYNKINDFCIIDDKKKVVQFINKSNILINDNIHNDNLNVKTHAKSRQEYIKCINYLIHNSFIKSFNKLSAFLWVQIVHLT